MRAIWEGRMGARYYLAGVVAVAVALGGLGMEPVVAAGPTIQATGDVQCIGPVKFWIDYDGYPDPRKGLDPALAYQTIVTVKSGTLRCRGTTGNAAITLTKAKVRGVVVRNFGSYLSTEGWTCRSITGVAGGGELALRWKAAGGKLQDTRVRFTNSRFRSAPPPIGGLLELPSAGPSAGSTTVTGSYAGTGIARASLADGLLGRVTQFPSYTCRHVAGRDKHTGTLTISL